MFADVNGNYYEILEDGKLYISRTPDKSEDIWCQALLPANLHKCHVFPWSAIKKIVDTLRQEKNKKERKKKFEAFIKLLFEVDKEAVYANQWSDSKFWIHTQSITEGPFPLSKTSSNYQSIFKKLQIIKLNDEYIKFARVKCIEEEDYGECEKYLFNAPANLRLGIGNINIKVNDRVDLMGKKDGTITEKEKKLLDYYHEYYDPNRENMLKSPYCLKIKGKITLLSSTSIHHGYVTTELDPGSKCT